VLVERLRELGAEVAIHDPYVREYQGGLAECVRGSDAVVVMVAHDEYRAIDLCQLRGFVEHDVLVDGRRVFTAEQAQDAGWIYRGVGAGETR
jgi:UDP-N-acetyl-D-mannosaminuronate dehydrogenase